MPRRDVGRRVERVHRAEHGAAEASRRVGARPRSRGGGPRSPADLHEHRRQPVGVRARPVRRRRAETRGARAGRARSGRPGSTPISLGDRAGDRALQLIGRACRSRPSRARRTACARARRRGRRARSPRRRADARSARRRSPSRAGVAAAAAAGRDEHDRALRLARGEHARELEQRGGPRQLGRATRGAAASRWARITIGALAGRARRAGRSPS